MVAALVIGGVLIALGVFVVDAALPLDRSRKTSSLNDWGHHEEQIANIDLLTVAHIYPCYAIAFA